MIKNCAVESSAQPLTTRLSGIVRMDVFVLLQADSTIYQVVTTRWLKKIT